MKRFWKFIEWIEGTAEEEWRSWKFFIEELEHRRKQSSYYRAVRKEVKRLRRQPGGFWAGAKSLKPRVRATKVDDEWRY